jgi:single-strand DNA-binding protein
MNSVHMGRACPPHGPHPVGTVAGDCLRANAFASCGDQLSAGSHVGLRAWGVLGGQSPPRVRLTADPTVHAGEQHASATFRLAIPRPGSDSADFVDIVTFDKLAGICADWLTKGREVAVVGKLRLSEWTDRNGEKRSRIQVVADAVSSSAPPDERRRWPGRSRGRAD